MKESYKLKYWHDLYAYSEHISLSTNHGYCLQANLYKNGKIKISAPMNEVSTRNPGIPETYIEWRHFLDEAQKVWEYYFGDI